jgi:hypothetical protein
VDSTTAPSGSIDAVMDMLVEDAPAENQVETEEDVAEAPDDDQPEAMEAESEELDDVDDADDTGDETDEEAEVAEQDDGDEEPASEIHTVKVDGEEKQVTLDDLKRSYSGQAYIQKGMEEAAQSKKQAEQVYQALQEERQKLATTFQQLQTEGAPQMPQKPSKELMNSDPIAYFEQMESYREGLEQYQQFQQQHQAMAQQQTEAQQRAQQAYLQEQARMLQQEIPEFSDPDKASKMKEQLLRTGVETYGYSPEEMTQIMDARAVKVLADAMKYRQLQQSKGKAVEKTKNARPVVKPGAKKSDTDGKVTRRKKAAARMKKNGNVDDVASFLLS